jgi:membrane-associated phospholipid phosphatase
VSSFRALARGKSEIVSKRPAAAYLAFVAHSIAYSQAFKLPHRDHAAQRARLRVRYPIVADRRLGAGVVPGARLQRLRRRPRVRSVLDRALGAVYFAWAPERHVALLWLAWRHPRQLERAAALVSLTFDVSLVFQALVPTAPPWWAAKYGHLQDGLTRVTVDASDALPLVPHQDADEAAESNPWASMPSPHTATAAILAVVLAETDRRAGALAAAYAAALAVALVYLGEHYVADVLAGLGLTAAVRAGEPVAARVARVLASRATG